MQHARLPNSLDNKKEEMAPHDFTNSIINIISWLQWIQFCQSTDGFVESSFR